MRILTGCTVGLSTAGLARVSAAVLLQCNAPPQIAGELGQLFPQWHRLIQVCQEVTDRSSGTHLVTLRAPIPALIKDEMDR